MEAVNSEAKSLASWPHKVHHAKEPFAQLDSAGEARLGRAVGRPKAYLFTATGILIYAFARAPLNCTLQERSGLELWASGLTST